MPDLFIALTKRQSSLSILLALIVSPTVDEVPSISMLSLIEMGIPKSGGKNISKFYSSPIIQFFFPVLRLISSHSAARLMAYSK